MQKRRINVLYAIDNLLIGGAQELVKTLSFNLNKDSFDVSVCSLLDYEGKGSKEPLTEEIAGRGIDVTTLHMKGWEDVEEKAKFIALLNEKKPDILHAHLHPTDLWSIRIAQSVGVPVKVYTKHETYHNKTFLERIKHAVYFNRYTDRALAISELSYQHLHKYELIRPYKIHKIFNPVDIDIFDPSKYSGELVRKEFGIPPSSVVIGNVARHVVRKGIHFFIDTASKVLKNCPGARFILVGYGEEERKYKSMVKSLGIETCFTFAGPRRDIPEILSAMDIFLFTPIWGESLPIALLEALAMRKAIVASNVCSNREVILHEVSGLLPTPSAWSSAVERLDTDALADSVIKLIKSPSLREEYGRQARRRAERLFGLQVVIEQFEDLYVQLLFRKDKRY